MFHSMDIELSENELPLFEQMMDDANGKSDAQKYATFLKIVQTGNRDLIDVYFDIHEDCGHIAHDKVRIISDLVSAPQNFSAPAKSFVALSKHIDMTDGYFGKQSHAFDTMLWRMYAAQPSADVVKVATTLMADYLRYRLLQDMSYKPDFSFLETDLKSNGLSAEMKGVSLKDSVVAIQNALVDYVANEGPNLPLNRGAAMLPILSQDAKAQTSALWTKKITDFKAVTGFHPVKGDVVIATPVFEPAS